MKYLLQIVAFMVVALLTVPTALAESICVAVSNQAENMECCDVYHVSALSAMLDAVQDCHEGCCSVAPQKSQAPAVPDKFKSDSSGLDTPVEAVSVAAYSPSDVTTRVVVATARAQDLSVLLHTFRI